MPWSSRWRSWSTYAAVLAAAAASVATSPLTWGVDGKLPELSSPPEGRAFRFAIESSHPQQLYVTYTESPAPGTLELHADGLRVTPLEDAGRNGGFPFLIYAGQKLKAASASGLCEDQGCCGGPCEAPSSAYVRVSGPTVLPSWSVEDRVTADFPQGEPCGLVLNPSVDRSRTLYELEQRGAVHIRYRVIPEDPQDAAHMSLSVGGKAPSGASPVMTLRWDCALRRSPRFTFVVSAQGVCEAEPCAAPQDATLANVQLNVVRQ